MTSAWCRKATGFRMGKIIKEQKSFRSLTPSGGQGVRQHAIATLNLTQQAKRIVTEDACDGSPTPP